MLELALACVRLGWEVFPVKVTPRPNEPGKTDKTPLIRWKEGATRDPDAVARLWRQFPDAHAAVATGRRSDLYVVDVDDRAALEASGLDLSQGRVRSTNRPGGTHFLYRSPADGRPVRNSAEGGLDVRGDGGFVVVWPDEPPGLPGWPLPDPVAAWARNRNGDDTGGPRGPVAEIIEEGGREAVMVSLAGTLRRRGMSENVILVTLREVNSERCRPPLGDGDLRRIAGSVMRYEAEPGVVPMQQVIEALQARSVGVDIGVLDVLRTSARQAGTVQNDGPTQWSLALDAERLIKPFARWREDERSWWVCSRNRRPGIWSRQSRMGVENALTNLVVSAKPNAPSSWTAGVEKYARGLLVEEPNAFDNHPWLLGVVGGVVDLRTGALLGPDPSLLLTRCAPTEYDPLAACPTWDAHLTRLLEHDPERVAWFQRAVGSSLVGDALEKDQVFVLLLGPPGNGKGTAMRALLHSLGQDQHAASIGPGDLTGRERHLAWMHRLRGARLAIVEELKRGPLDVAKVKTLTGGDTIVANRMRQEDETWRPTHTLFMTANHRPNFGGDTAGMERRYKPVPTGPSLTREEMSPEHEEMLRAESAGILAWAVRGCLMWQADGRRLPACHAIDELALAHIADDDPHEEWATECVELPGDRAEGAPEAWSSRKQVVSCANWWRAGRGLPGLTDREQKELYAWLREHGARDERKHRQRTWCFNVAVLAGPVVD